MISKYGTNPGSIGFYGKARKPIERPKHADAACGMNAKERRKQRQRNRRQRLRAGE